MRKRERGIRNIERPEKCPVDCMDASIDALQALQRDGVGRPFGLEIVAGIGALHLC